MKEPTPVATCSADVSRAEITSTMVLRSNDVREIRSYVDKPEPESRQEVVSRSEMELAAEIAAPISVREGFRATRRSRSSTERQTEVVLPFPLSVRPEITPDPHLTLD